MAEEKASHREAEEALAFLKSSTLAAVSTASRDGKPEVAFVYYVTDDDFNLFFLTRRDSLKFRNILENGRAAIAVGNEDEVKTVQMAGKIEEVTEEGEIARHTHLIIRSPKLASLYMRNAPMNFLPPRVPQPDGTHFALVRLRPDWLRWMRKNLETDEPEYFTIIAPS
ncbi:MAG: hypothetical protein RL272_723 [Candidatus Parcubacteria bacterium]|jgi:uncharacterized pyridoxamine 5'-phosphate oxidase family protein